MSNGAQIQRVRLALIGAGIFARDAHLPALAQLRDQFELVAVHSRSLASAEALVERWGRADQLGEPGLPADAEQRPAGLGMPDVFTDLAALLAL